MAAKENYPANNEIVDELTKDLEENLTTDFDSKAKERSDLINKLNVDNLPDKEVLEKRIQEEEEEERLLQENKANKNSSTLENDVTEDDEYKSEMNENLTEEEKEERRSESQVLKSEGNEKYKNEQYDEAIKNYTQALLICPACFSKERSIMYSNRAACHMKLENNDKAIKDCTHAINLNPNYTKAVLRRAQLYENSEKLDEALTDYKKIIELEPKNIEANHACATLPQRINERNEKLKAEMMGKLKDLGNMILKPFGLSTNNFQLNQDPNSGGYSVNFQGNGNPSKKP